MTKKNSPPTDPMGIAGGIIQQGGFANGMAFLINFMRSDTSSTLIIRGDIGCGKKTVIAESQNMCKKTICIYLSASHHCDDYSAIRFIAKKLGLELKPSLQEMITEIEERSGDMLKGKKIVIILKNFEDFCRQKQSLLYSLTHLTQHGKNISLIGLTISLDCTEHLEKRVRSRMNANFYELKPPYSNIEEYVKMASLLLGKYKISGRLQQQLEYMYTFGNRSIRTLKRYLLSICDWDENGKMTVTMPTEIFDPSNDVRDMIARLYSLTDPQLELLKIVVCCCAEKKNLRTEFTLSQLETYTKNHDYNSFDTRSQLTITIMALLVKIGFLKASKPQLGVDRSIPFTINIMPLQLKRILQNNPALHKVKSDPLWKNIERQ